MTLMSNLKSICYNIDPNESYTEPERSWHMTGLSAPEDELKVPHDVFSATVQPGAQKASFIVQFLW